MSDRARTAAAPPRRAPARRPGVGPTVLRVGAAAFASAALLWAVLFGNALVRHAVASTTSAPASPSSSQDGTSSAPSQTVAPVITKTS